MIKLFRARNITFLFCSLLFLFNFDAGGSGEEPIKVGICQLKADPAAYNHKLVQVTGFVSHGFEDFTLFEPSCSSWPEVWLEYGGFAASGTMYCCGVTADRKRPKQLVVENMPISLLDDDRFREFDKLMQRRPDSVVHATIVGRFFSGEQTRYSKSVSWGGYGHMGCCSLLAIQRVISVEPHDRDDLDYSASADSPDLTKLGCGYRSLLPVRTYNSLIEAHREAENSEDEWRFSDPQRVASDALARALNIEGKSIAELRETRKAHGRLVFQWHPKEKRVSYMIVVSRPYWLSFYARDTNRIAWVAIAAYESSCR